MNQIFYFVMFIIGLAMIIKGSDWFLDSVIWVSNVFKIPQILIGATIISICTTLPETLVAVSAAAISETGVAFGNSIGSIATNTGLILAISIIFSKPVINNRKDFLTNGGFLISLLIAITVIGFTLGKIDLLIGIIFVALLVLYLVHNAVSAKKQMNLKIRYELENDDVVQSEKVIYEGVAIDYVEREIDISKRTVIKYIFFFVIGILLLIFGSNILVDNGIKIAEILGVPSIVIAVTFTAFGTSLPEIVTTITSIRKKAPNLGVGNVIGANILNIIQAIGISALVTTIPLNNNNLILQVQLPLTLAIVILAIGFGAFSKKGFQRWQGVLLLLLYIAFVVLNFI